MVKTQLRFEIRLRRKFAEKKWPTYTESVKYKMWWVPLKPCLVEIFENLSEKCKRRNWKVFFKNVFSCFQEIGRDNFVNYATAQLFFFFFSFSLFFLSFFFLQTNPDYLRPYRTTSDVGVFGDMSAKCVICVNTFFL